MNLNIDTYLPTDFSPSSRVWIYQSSRLLSMGEVFELEPMLQAFVANWKSHGKQVKGWASLFFGQFIIVMADETATGVSGCSTDSSVQLMKTIEQKFGIELFNRQMLAFIVKDSVQVLPLSQLNYAIDNNFINGNTLYFNNLVNSKETLTHNWIVPVANSWLANRFNQLQP
jgi:hypothetical protein